ncbi:MAG: OmpH family outer membrane protein [Pseudomonadota bacterium]
MFSFRTLFMALALTFSSAVHVTIAAPSAQAQGTKILVIDNARILRDSLAGKDMEAKLDNIEKAIATELETVDQNLQSALQSLTTRSQGKTEAQLEADTALRNEWLQYRQASTDGRNINRQFKSEEMKATELLALSEFQKALEPVLQQVANERGAQVILGQNRVVYASDAVDVTDSVIAKLNARTTTINVVRQRIQIQRVQQPTQPQ